MQTCDLERYDIDTGRHGFAGFDRFVGCCVATCRCGWTGRLEQSEDSAIVGYGIHLVQMCLRRVKL